jgi:diguanylate cyclase
MFNEHQRSFALGKFALAQLESLQQPATPRNFEIWYVYAAAQNPALNTVLNETLSREGRLTEIDLQHIYDTYLSPARNSERVDEMGTRVMREIDSVLDAVDQAIGLKTSFSDVLQSVDKSLAQSTDHDQMRSIVEGLLNKTRTMQLANQQLEQRLTESRREIGSLHENLAAIRAESLTDPLTTIANRKSFDRAISHAIAESVECKSPLSVLMLDIDHFKAFNDTYGHLTGDQVLRLVALSLKQCVKGQDVAARYGGEEFAVLLPNTTLRQAHSVAEHIRLAVMSRELKKKSTDENLGRITVSVGAATSRIGDDANALIERADASLYAAKRAGRNCVVLECDLTETPERQASAKHHGTTQHHVLA